MTKSYNCGKCGMGFGVSDDRRQSVERLVCPECDLPYCCGNSHAYRPDRNYRVSVTITKATYDRVRS